MSRVYPEGSMSDSLSAKKAHFVQAGLLTLLLTSAAFPPGIPSIPCPGQITGSVSGMNQNTKKQWHTRPKDSPMKNRYGKKDHSGGPVSDFHGVPYWKNQGSIPSLDGDMPLFSHAHTAPEQIWLKFKTLL